MVETSMTFSTCVVYNIWSLGTFNFLESKAIAHCRSAIFDKVMLILTMPSNLGWDAPVKENKYSTCSNLNRNSTPTVGYSVGIQIIEGSKISKCIHQKSREGLH